MEHPGLPPLDEAAHLALDDLEDPDESAATRDRALQQLRPQLEASCTRLAASLARALDQAHALDAASCAGGEPVRKHTQDRPLALLAWPTGRSLVAEALGAQLDGPLVERLEELAEPYEQPNAAALVKAMVGAAYDKDSCTPALRHFRLAVLDGFHPQVRASALCVHDPERAELALELAARHADAAALIDAFDQARAEADIEAANMAPGPPRHFSWVHVAFAIVIAALTAYHYLFR